ncbi:LysM peptidoglycan-binding domain-containing protein, partial [Neisseria elongata]
MLKKTALRTGSLAAVLMLGACSWLQQPAAPVVEGTNTGVGMQNTESSITGGNPYGAAPYEPSASVGNMGGNAPVYTPPPTISSPSVSGSTYVPSYAPVDINAATHKVVRGDTVYNISKRYNITQDNLRAWNGLTDNNISVGQTLRVKPAGYVAPASSTVVHKPEPA